MNKISLAISSFLVVVFVNHTAHAMDGKKGLRHRKGFDIATHDGVAKTIEHHDRLHTEHSDDIEKLRKQTTDLAKRVTALESRPTSATTPPDTFLHPLRALPVACASPYLEGHIDIPQRLKTLRTMQTTDARRIKALEEKIEELEQSIHDQKHQTFINRGYYCLALSAVVAINYMAAEYIKKNLDTFSINR